VIFGAVVDPAMEGEVRVTVIATGFDRREAKETGAGRAAGVIQFPQRQVANLRASGQQVAAAGGGSAPGSPARRSSPQITPPPGPAAPVAEPLSDMEIPTFIRRQMD
jgi:cell division protein FtsZ